MTPEAENYCRELSRIGYGRPVYDPDPGSNYDRARIGDVGYFAHLGGFCRLFNALYPANHPINSDGVPDGFIAMEDKYVDVHTSQPLSAGVICRLHVNTLGGDFDLNCGAIPAGAKINLSCTEQCWAALVISQPATREDAKSDKAFKDYIIKNHQSWLAFARNERGIEISLKDIVFVTGLDMTHEWATASVFDWNKSWEIGLDVNFPGSGTLSASAWCSWSSSVRLPLRSGPSPHRPRHNKTAIKPSNLANSNSFDFIDSDEPDARSEGAPEPNQCIFMRGYRISTRPLLPPKIKAAAGPKDEEGRDADEGNPSPIAVRLSGIDSDDDLESDETRFEKSQTDMFEVASNYIFKNSDADAVVLHDHDVFMFDALYNRTGAALDGPGSHVLHAVHADTESVNGLKIGSLRSIDNCASLEDISGWIIAASARQTSGDHSSTHAETSLDRMQNRESTSSKKNMKTLEVTSSYSPKTRASRSEGAGTSRTRHEKHNDGVASPLSIISEVGLDPKRYRPYMVGRALANSRKRKRSEAPAQTPRKLGLEDATEGILELATSKASFKVAASPSELRPLGPMSMKKRESSPLLE